MAKQKIKDVMTKAPLTMRSSATLRAAAEAMREGNIGGLCVVDDDESVCGFVTDRDIVVRGIAQGMDPHKARLDSICSKSVLSLSPEDSVDSAVKTMASGAVRRIPVMDDSGKAVGIVSIGDLAQASEERSALAGISAAPPNV